MKLIKRAIAITTSVILLTGFSSSYALDTINLNEYIEEAKIDNTEYSLLLDKLPRENTEYNKAVQIANSIDQKTFDESTDDYNLKVKKEITPLEKNKILLNLKYDILKKENTLEQNATKLYYDYIVTTKDYENTKERYETALKKYESKKKEKELGLVSDIDLMKFEQEYYTSFISYLNKTNEFENLKKNININRSKDLDTPIDFELIDIESVDTNYSINVEEIKPLALKNSYQIKSLELQNKINEITLETKTRNAGFTNIVTEMNTLNNSIKENNKKIEDIKSDIEYNLIKLSNEVKIEKNKYAISEMDYNLSKLELVSSKIKFESGLISAFDYEGAKQGFESKEIEFNKSRISMAMKILEAKAYVEENTTLIK